MNKVHYFGNISFWVCMMLFMAGCNQPEEEDTLFKSPDGNVVFRLETIDDQLNYSVKFKGKDVIQSSPIAMSVDKDTLTTNVQIGNIRFYEANETYERMGSHSTAVNHYNGAEIAINKSDNKDYILDVRVFNDAAAFRLLIPEGEKKSRIPDEATAFNLPQGSIVWFHDLGGHYESVHEKSNLSDIPEGSWLAPPVTFRLSENSGYAAITEANLKDYSGLAFQIDSSQSLIGKLAHDHPVSYPYELRYSEEDITRLSKPATVKGKIQTPWRVILVADNLNAMVNSDVIHNLNPAPDEELFPRGINTSWIKPGRAVWKYLDGGGEGNLKNMKDFSRMAAELGFEHNILEGFWRDWSDEEIKELVDYSKKRGVGIWVWEHSKNLQDSTDRKVFFQRVHDLGITGVKLDFFDHEAKEVIDIYQDILRETAEHQILVDFHGANKPTGESRTWPNELTREAVRGMESRNVENKAQHNTTIPFTRWLAGHAEYTPVHFGERMGNTTMTHQIASAAIMNSPLLTYAAHPENLLKNPGVEIIKSIPSNWDETQVLPISEIGEIAAFARRKGETWFLAIMNGSEQKNVEIKLSFLQKGDYSVLTLRDDLDDPKSLKIENNTVTQQENLNIELADGGGFIGRFRKQETEN